MKITILSVIFNALCWTLATIFAIGILIVPIYAVIYVIGG